MTHDIFTYDEVFDAAVTVTNSTRADVIGQDRTQTICFARVVLVGCLREMAGITSPSYPEIARVLCRKSHGAIQHRYKRWEALDFDKRETWKSLVRSEIFIARKRKRSCVTTT